MSLNLPLRRNLSQANRDLLLACYNNNISRLRQALASGASPNLNFCFSLDTLQLFPEGLTPLLYCAWYNSKECFAFLMSLQEIDVKVATTSKVCYGKCATTTEKTCSLMFCFVLNLIWNIWESVGGC